MSKFVTCTETNSIAELVLNHPGQNTMTVEILDAITNEFSRLTNLQGTGRPRVVVIKSALPQVYSFGVDPAVFLAADMTGRERIFQRLMKFMEAVLMCGIPVVTDINGPAMAGGAVLAGVSDFATMSREHGKLSFSELKVGIPIPGPVLNLAARKVHPGRLMEMLLLGKNYNADEALAVGFVNHVYANPQERDEWIQGMTGKLSRLSPEVVRATLLASRAGVVESFRAFDKDFKETLTPFLSDDFLGKGLRALVAGVSPKF